MHVRSELGETSVSSQALSELGAGEIVEAGKPVDLLQDPRGQLRQMVDELGPAALQHFLRIARGELSVVDTLKEG